MSAVVIREFGPPEVLSYDDPPTPRPGIDEVLIRLHGPVVNGMELDVREGEAGYNSRRNPCGSEQLTVGVRPHAHEPCRRP